MSYPGITFVFMISVAIGSALYYYFNGDWRQQQNQHNAHGYRTGNEYDYHDYPYVNVSRSTSPSNSKKRRKETKGDECPICLQSMNPHSTRTLSCDHKFHVQCIKKWFDVNARNSCPVCRRE